MIFTSRYVKTVLCILLTVIGLLFLISAVAGSDAGDAVQLTADREIAVSTARQGDIFFIVYTLTNTGTADITDIKIKETAAKKTEDFSVPLKPGEQKKISFMVSMGSYDMISSAEITFRANDAAHTVNVEEQIIRLGRPDLSLIVSCDDNDVNIGGTATLKITFENKGTISYSNITVSDKNLGQLLEGKSVEAGETREFCTDVTLEGPAEFELTAVMDDNTGKTGIVMRSNKLKVNVHASANDPDPNRNPSDTDPIPADDKPVSTPQPLFFTYVKAECSRLGLSFEMPDEWITDEEEDRITYTDPDMAGGYNARFEISKGSSSSSLSKTALKEILADCLEQMRADEGCSEWVISEPTERKLTGHEGFYATFHGYADGVEIRGRVHIAAVSDQEWIMISYACSADYVSDYYNVYDKLRTTLKIN